MLDELKIIRRNEKDFPPETRFADLRRRGLEYLGQFSGKIWTDHNTHDPGITILEALIFSLMDLGYRARLPIEDLIARPDSSQPDDQFFSPADILTNNPVTEIDWRKLLLEVPGVRNAWLEPDWKRSSEPVISLSTNQTGQPILTCQSAIRNPQSAIILNGLWKVFIEKEPTIPDSKAIEKVLIPARTALLAHRNLCEDFTQICLLCPAEIGICAEIEVETDSRPEEIYRALLLAIREFLAPELRFYSLRQLLEKGRSMEEIMAGRPRLPESFGFLDTVELEKFTLRKEFHLSDIYQILGAMPGVRAVRNLTIDGLTPQPPLASGQTTAWIYRLAEGHVPVFSVEKTCFHLTSRSGQLFFDKKRIHDSLPAVSRNRLNAADLDEKQPNGRFRPDLGDHFSIQHDFPRVYGIGPGGLPDDAPLERQAEARQLKAFLLFFDRLLADYLAQLKNLRQLFSLQPERLRAEKQTLFTQQMPSVPDGEGLIRFFSERYKTVPDGTRLASPILFDADFEALLTEFEDSQRRELRLADRCDDPVELQKDQPNLVFATLRSWKTAAERNTAQAQFRRDLERGNRQIIVRKDGAGFFFVIRPAAVDGAALLGTKRYPTSAEANEAAGFVSFVASLAGNFQKVNRSEMGDFAFDIVFRPVDYPAFLQKNLESQPEYEARRESLLDHLLARFGEAFTDFALIQFSRSGSGNQPAAVRIGAKSEFLHDLPAASRDRGRAFDYSRPAWNSANVSGYEHRASLLAGMADWRRRSLSPFEVVACPGEIFTVGWRDREGRMMVGSPLFFHSKPEANAAAEILLNSLKTIELSENSASFGVRSFDARSLLSPALLNRPDWQLMTENLQLALGFADADRRVTVAERSFFLRLTGPGGQIVRADETGFATGADAFMEADRVVDDFLKIQIGIGKTTASKNSKPDKLEARNQSSKSLINLRKIIDPRIENSQSSIRNPKSNWLNINQFDVKTEAVPTTWRWHLLTDDGLVFAQKETGVLDPDEAWRDVVRHEKFERFLEKNARPIRWNLGIEPGLALFSTELFAAPPTARNSCKKTCELAAKPGNCQVVPVEEGRWQIQIRAAKTEAIIAYSTEIEPTEGQKPADFLARFLENLGTVKKDPKLPPAPEAWGFRIPSDGRQPLLTSYALYETREEALQKLLEALERSSKAANFSRSGDELNSNFSFALNDAHDRFLATCPKTFDEETDRETALENTRLACEKTGPPVKISKDPTRWTWSVADAAGQQVLRATGSSESEILARVEAVHSLCLAPVSSNWSFADDVFSLCEPPEEESDFRSKPVAFIENLNENAFRAAVFEVKTERLPSAWNFCFDWREAAGLQSVSFESRAVFYLKDFDSADQARAAAATDFRKFLTDLPATSWADLTRKLIEPADEDERKSWLTALDDLVQETRAIRTGDAATILAGLVQPVGCSDCHDGEFIYRLLRRDLPMACSPTDFSIEKWGCEAAPKAAEVWAAELKKFNHLIYRPLELVECGPVALEIEHQKEDGSRLKRWHFVIRPRPFDAANWLFLSFVTFDNEAAAQAAFDENLFDFLAAAADLATLKNRFLPLVEPILDAGECVSKTGQMGWFLPKFIGKEAELNQLARSYPIQVEVDSTGKRRFRYQLWTDQMSEIGSSIPGRVVWQSIDRFENAEAARAAFELFERQLRHPEAIRVFQKNGTWTVAAFEILAESKTRFLNADRAWGGFFRDENGTCREIGLAHLLTIGTSLDSTFFEFLDAQGRYGFDLVDTDFLAGKTTRAVPFSETADRQNQAQMALADLCEWHKDDWLALRNKFAEHWKLEPSMSPPMPDLFEKMAETARNGANYSINTSPGGPAKLVCPVRDQEPSPLSRTVADIASLSDFIRESVRLANAFFAFKNMGGEWVVQLFETAEDQPTGACDCGKPAENVQVGEVFFESAAIELPAEEDSSRANEEQKALDKLCVLAKSDPNWKLRGASDCGEHHLWLIDPTQILACHPHRYDRRTDLKTAIEHTRAAIRDEGMHLVEHLLLRPRAATECRPGCLLPPCPDACLLELPIDDPEDPCATNFADGHPTKWQPGADPYSFWATLVLPDWMRRFRSTDTRFFMENLLRAEAPAAVALDIRWLSPKEMADFDDHFHRWLDWLTASVAGDFSAICPPFAQPCEMVAALQPSPKIDGICPPEAALTVGDDCEKCHKSNEKPPGETFGFLYDCQLASRDLPIPANLPPDETVGGGLAQPTSDLTIQEAPLTDFVEPIAIPAARFSPKKQAAGKGELVELGETVELVEKTAAPERTVSIEKMEAVSFVSEKTESAEKPVQKAARPAKKEAPKAKFGNIEPPPAEVLTASPRQILTERARRWQVEMRGLDSEKLLKKSPLFMQANFILNPQKTWDDWQKLADEIFQKHLEKQAAKPAEKAAFFKLLGHATRYFLDHEAFENPAGPGPETVARLEKLTENLNAAKLPTADLIENWQPAELENALPKSVSGLLEILKK